jgi:hypothetical protein
MHRSDSSAARRRDSLVASFPGASEASFIPGSCVPALPAGVHGGRTIEVLIVLRTAGASEPVLKIRKTHGKRFSGIVLARAAISTLQRQQVRF